jgi:hypothetical protein
MRFSSRNGETTTTIDFITKYNQTQTITQDGKREYRIWKSFGGWTLCLTYKKEIIFDIPFYYVRISN